MHKEAQILGAVLSDNNIISVTLQLVGDYALKPCIYPLVCYSLNIFYKWNKVSLKMLIMALALSDGTPSYYNHTVSVKE